MVSPYKNLKITVKYFSKYFAYEKLNQPDTWRASLYIHLLTFPYSGLYLLTYVAGLWKERGRGFQAREKGEKRARGGVGNAGKDANVVFFVHIYQRDKEILID